MCPPVPRIARGFTLVEVLVAMTIMSLIAIMSWQGVDGIVRSRDISQARLEKLLRLNTVLSQWEQDLLAVQDTGLFPRALDFDGKSLTLTRRAQGGIQLVVWSLQSGEWKRWAGPPVTTAGALQNQWQASRQFIGTEQGQLRVLSNVERWQLYYYVENAWANAQSTSDSPGGVRLVLTIAGAAGLNGQVTRDIALAPRPSK
jgi:general secretion pathway protein J